VAPGKLIKLEVIEYGPRTASFEMADCVLGNVATGKKFLK